MFVWTCFCVESFGGFVSRSVAWLDGLMGDG